MLHPTQLGIRNHVVQRYPLRRAASLVLLLAAYAQANNETIDAEANRLVVIKPPRPAAFIINEPLGLDYKQFELKDGSTVLVVFTATYQRIVVTSFANGETIPVVTQWVIRVANAPTPPTPNPPNPNPTPPTPSPLTGLALEVFKQAQAVNLTKPYATILGTSYRAVGSAIAAGGIKTVADARAQLAERNAKKWPRSAAKLLEFVTSTTPPNTTLEQFKTVCLAIAEAFDAI